MAKVTITIEDAEDSLKLNFQFDPPYMNDESEKTPAQMLGYEIAEQLGSADGANVRVIGD